MQICIYNACWPDLTVILSTAHTLWLACWADHLNAKWVIDKCKVEEIPGRRTTSSRCRVDSFTSIGCVCPIKISVIVHDSPRLDDIHSSNSTTIRTIDTWAFNFRRCDCIYPVKSLRSIIYCYSSGNNSIMQHHPSSSIHRCSLNSKTAHICPIQPPACSQTDNVFEFIYTVSTAPNPETLHWMSDLENQEVG